MRIVLASGSRIRAALLRNAGVPFDVAPADIDEATLIADHQAGRLGEPSENDDHAALAIRLATAKATAISEKTGPAIVIGADQLLVFQGEILQKPRSLEEAAVRLRTFSGQAHALFTGCAVLRPGAAPETLRARADVVFNDLTDGDVARYVEAAGSAVLETVGGYEIEGLGARLIARVRGDHFAALGLPLFDILPLLAAPYSHDLG